MKILELSEATAPLADYAQNATDEPVILTMEGLPYAALVTVSSLHSSEHQGRRRRLSAASTAVEAAARRTLRSAMRRKLREEGREFEAEVESLSNNPKFIALLERSDARLREEGGLTSEELRRELGLD